MSELLKAAEGLAEAVNAERAALRSLHGASPEQHEGARSAFLLAAERSTYRALLVRVAESREKGETDGQ